MNVRNLLPELQKIAEEELNERPDNIEEELTEIKEWLKKQTHLRTRLDDQWLLGFLRGCKHNIHKTKENLDLFYTAITLLPEISVSFSTNDPDIQELLRIGAILPILKSKKPHHARVILLRPGSFDASKIGIHKMVCLSQMFLNMQMRDDDQSMIAGQIYVVDMKNVDTSLITQLTLSLVSQIIMYRQDVLPIRIKGTHFINIPSSSEKLITVAKHFLNENQINKLYIHTNYLRSLNIFVSKSILPIEYGGKAGPVANIINYWKETIGSNEDFFIDNNQYKTDESKRIGSLPDLFKIFFDTDVSFRQLNID